MSPEDSGGLTQVLLDAIGENDPEGDGAQRAAGRERRFWLLVNVLRNGAIAAADRTPEQLRGDLADDLAAILRTGHASPRLLHLVANFLQDLDNDALIGRLLGDPTSGRPKTRALLESRCIVAYELALGDGSDRATALEAAYDARKGKPGAYRTDSTKSKVATVGAKEIETTVADEFLKRHVWPVLNQAGLGTE